MDAGDVKDLRWAEGLESLTGKEFVLPQLPNEGQGVQSPSELDKYLYAKELGIIGVGRSPSEDSTLAIGPCVEVPEPQLGIEGQSTFRFAQEGSRVRANKDGSNPNNFGLSSASITYPQLSTHVYGFASNDSPFLFGLNPYLFPPDGGNPNHVSKGSATRDMLALPAADNYHQMRHVTSSLGVDGSKIALPEPKLESHLLAHEGLRQDQLNHPLGGSTKRGRKVMQNVHNLKTNIDALHEGGSSKGKKLDVRKCSRCNRIFLNGQAYGGHMSHHGMKARKIEASKKSLRIRDAAREDEAQKASAVNGDHSLMKKCSSSDRKGKGKLI